MYTPPLPSLLLHSRRNLPEIYGITYISGVVFIYTCVYIGEGVCDQSSVQPRMTCRFIISL